VNVHKNARLTPAERALLVERIESGERVEVVAGVRDPSGTGVEEIDGFLTHLALLRRLIELGALGTLLATVACTPPEESTSCLGYEPDTVQVAGTLGRHVFPGPPAFRSVAEGDVPEEGFYLHLAEPVCTVGDTLSPDAYPVPATDTIQLVLDSTTYARLRPRLGTTVTLRGTLFARHTGHHHAPLLLQVIGQE